MIVEAPLPFIVGWVLFGALAYALARHQFSDRIFTANDRIKLKDDQIAAYREKLDGASPDEARAQIDTLRDEVNTLRAEIKAITPPSRRHLLPDSISILQKSLKDFASLRVYVVPTNDEECYDYASELVSALNQCGMIAELDSYFGSPDPRKRDLDVYFYKGIEQRTAEEFQSALAFATGSPCHIGWMGIDPPDQNRLGQIGVNRPSA